VTLTEKPNIVLRVGRNLLAFAIANLIVYLLLWAGLEGYKFVGR
jgi:hypothetical protein